MGKGQPWQRRRSRKRGSRRQGDGSRRGRDERFAGLKESEAEEGAEDWFGGEKDFLRRI